MIYLDNAATTRTAPEVVEAMLPYFTEYYGNAGSIYGLGSASKKAVIQAKQTIARSLGAEPNEIYFTAGGTESDNWALKAVFETYRDKGTSLHPGLSIMPFCIHVNIWRDRVRRSPIWMWMKMESWI